VTALSDRLPSRRGQVASPAIGRRARLAVRIAAAIAVVALLMHVAHGELGLGGHALDGFFDDWVYDGVMAGAALCVLARAWLIEEHRRCWLILGAGMASFAIGEVYYSLAFGDSGNPPIPSLADFFYLLYYPCLYAGLIMLARARIERFSPSTWLDGAIAATASAAVIAAVVFEPIARSAAQGDAAAVATNFAYPVGDLILLGIVAWTAGLSGWRPGRGWLLLGVGLVFMAIADIGYLYETANNTYAVGGWLDTLWMAAACVTALAAWQLRGGIGTFSLEGKRLLVVPAVFALAALGVLVVGSFDHMTPVALILAAISVALIFVRGGWTFSENLRLLEASQHDAQTDALTGLGNRRAMNLELERALACASTTQPFVLTMFDLDGFKAYNDRFGHVAGDTLLTHLGGRLAEAVGGAGSAFRLGGDEFCLLIPGTRVQARPCIAAAIDALAADGDGFSVTTSYGLVEMPSEASTAMIALRIADDRMYAQKGRRRGSARQQTHDVLLEVMHERQPEVHQHLREVGRLAELVGSRLGMDDEQLDELHRAAELHDVGKAAVPDAILSKPGPLDDAEWMFMRRHTIVGERILAAAPALVPVALIVRSSHERWDGTGYPDHLSGEEIPLGARIVAVCDAFDAMISQRPYAPAMTPEAALAELRRHAGTQFDPAVVAAFEQAWLEYVGEGDRSARRALRAVARSG
jgi:two-component system, cell cycle response regulator